MPIADMVRALIEAGTPAEMAAVVVAEAFVAGVNSTGIPLERRLAKIRSADRDRKRSKSNSTGIPLESSGNEKTALTLSSSLEIENKKEKKVRARKCPLSADWLPSEVHFEAAANLGIDRDAVLGKAEDMRLWAGSTGALKVDWDLTFHGFIRRDADKLAAKSAKGGSNGKTGNAILDGLDATIRELRAPGIRSGAGTDYARMLPQGRGERPEPLRESGGSPFISVYPVRNPGSDTPADRAAEQNRLHADSERAETRMRAGSAEGNQDQQQPTGEVIADVRPKAGP